MIKIPFPYIQALHGFDDSTRNYAIQVIGKADASEPLPEDDPLLVFGPLGRINIFVGATNSGKSRFLRTLAKNKTVVYPGKEMMDAFRSLERESDFLARHKAMLRFQIDQSPSKGQMRDGSPIVFYQMPEWVKEAIGKIARDESFDVTFDSNYFSKLKRQVRHLLSERLDLKTNSTTFVSDFESVNTQKYSQAVNLLRSERQAQESDQTLQNSGGWRIPDAFTSLEFRGKNFRVNDSLTLDLSKTTASWERSFLSFWDNFTFLREASPVQKLEPSQRIYIPTLRSAVTLSDKGGSRIEEDIFESSVRHNYDIKDESLEILVVVKGGEMGQICGRSIGCIARGSGGCG